MKSTKKTFTAIAGFTLLGVALAGCASGEGAAEGSASGTTINFDYAYWNPLSLVVQDQKCLENALGPDATVNWVLSTGSNKANENLNAEAIDIGSTAGVAAQD